MVAKTYAAFYDLQLQLHLGTFGREYTALVHGWLAPSRIAVSTKARLSLPAAEVSESAEKVPTRKPLRQPRFIGV